MSGLFSTFNIVKRGMMAHQTALHVVSHNVANADTEGYSVQRANLKTSEPFGMPSLSNAGTVGQLGTGVLVDSITRARDIFLDGQIRKELSTVNNYDAREQFLSEIETIFMEPSDTGLSTNLSKFWDSWNQLAMNPESSTARTLVVENGDDLAAAIRHNYEQLCDLEKNAGDIIKNQIFETNNILEQIGDLNEQIKSVVVAGLQPNDLLDRRDLLLNQLSERFSFDTNQTNFQGIEIIPKVDGFSDSIVVDKNVKYNLDYIAGAEISADHATLKLKLYKMGDSDNVEEVTITDPSLINEIINVDAASTSGYGTSGLKIHSLITTNNGTPPTVVNAPAKFKDGSLNGYEAINADVEDYKSRLNKLARALFVTVNTLHSNSTDPNGDMNFFVSNDSTKLLSNIENGTEKEAAKYIQVNSKFVLDVSALDAGKDASGDGNGERARLIGSLRNLRIDVLDIGRAKFLQDNFNISPADPIPDLTQVTAKTKDSGFTIDSYFKDAISKLGVDSQQAQKMVKNQGALLAQLETRRESISGVSLDEEMTNMIQFQRSYEANAKMISVIDQLLDVVVNGLVR